jgi:hypothetical protein
MAKAKQLSGSQQRYANVQKVPETGGKIACFV